MASERGATPAAVGGAGGDAKAPARGVVLLWVGGRRRWPSVIRRRPRPSSTGWAATSRPSPHSPRSPGPHPTPPSPAPPAPPLGVASLQSPPGCASAYSLWPASLGFRGSQYRRTTPTRVAPHLRGVRRSRAGAVHPPKAGIVGFGVARASAVVKKAAAGCWPTAARCFEKPNQIEGSQDRPRGSEPVMTSTSRPPLPFRKNNEIQNQSPVVGRS
jgi:hypothetical protein